MKIRIKGASLRLRLSKSEVARLAASGSVTDETPFGDRTFRYAVQGSASDPTISATFAGDTITMHVPNEQIRDWDKNDVISIDAHMPLPSGGSLYLLLEKDFQCLDKTTEDQSDNYTNPNKTC